MMPNTHANNELTPKKSRKLNRVLPQLKRNSACLQCRRRRIKCDAGKPHCASCVRSFNFLSRSHPDPARDSEGIQCSYDENASDEEGESPGNKRKGSIEEDAVLTVRKLEARVVELQAAIARSKTPVIEGDIVPTSSAPSSILEPTPQLPPPDFIALSSKSSGVTLPVSDERLLPTRIRPDDLEIGILGSPLGMHTEFGNVFQPTSGLNGEPTYVQASEDLNAPSNPIHVDENVLADLAKEAGELGGPFLEVFFPGWPKNLPTPAMVDHLVYTFFTMVPSVPRILHRATFETRLALPPRHADFPHPALLHAICAVAARFTGAISCPTVSEVLDRLQGLTTDKDAEGNDKWFADRHAKYASQAMLAPSGNLMDILQTGVVLGVHNQHSAKFMEGWLGLGVCIRSAVFLGLFEDVPRGETPVGGQRLLPPPENEQQREERRVLANYVLMADLSFSSAASCAGVVQLDEFTTRLPAARAHHERGSGIPENPQTIHSPDLYTHHPVEDSLVMAMKGSLLNGRAAKLNRKLRTWTAGERKKMEYSPAVQQLDQDINAFVATFPISLRDPMRPMLGTASRIDADLIAAHLVPNVAAITLHEIFANLQDLNCPHAMRVYIAARACLGVVYQIINGPTDVTYMLVPVISMWLFTAAKTILAFYRRSMEMNDWQGAQTALTEIGVFQVAFTSLGARFPIGALHNQMLETLLREIQTECSEHQLLSWTGPSNMMSSITSINTYNDSPNSVNISESPGEIIVPGWGGLLIPRPIGVESTQSLQYSSDTVGQTSSGLDPGSEWVNWTTPVSQDISPSRS